MKEACVFVASEAVNNGIGSIENQIPQLHASLAQLGNFQRALIEVWEPGAYTWPNVELHDYAYSVIELGLGMRQAAVVSGDVVSVDPGVLFSHRMQNSGLFLARLGNDLIRLADHTYFDSYDLSGVVAANQPQFELSVAIVNGLAVDAIAAGFSSCKENAGLDWLTYLITAYVRSSPLNGKVKSTARKNQ